MAESIPKGDNKEDVYTRRGIIIKRLAPLIGTSVPCAAFSPKKVKIVFASIDETATRAAKRYESTLAALHIVEALKKALLIKTDLPHSKKQQKMKFIKMHELRTELPKIGVVKIMVGERSQKKYVHYCITQKKDNP